MSFLKYLLANLLIVAVLYSNSAVIGNYLLRQIPARLPLAFSRMPITRSHHDLFDLFGVFSYFENTNRDIEIFGITAPRPESPEGDVILLDRDEFFPYPLGETHMRIAVERHGYVLGDGRRQEEMRALARRIRERHNRLHPERPIEKIAIALVGWPRSIEGFERFKDSEEFELFYYE